MKKACFKYQVDKNRSIYGQVILKDDGKISISLQDAKYFSYANKHQAKNLGKKIVEAGFIHEAIYGKVENTESSQGLKAQLIELTSDFKADYIVKVKEAAKNKFADFKEKNARSFEEWMIAWNIPMAEKKAPNFSAWPLSYNREYYKMRSKIDSIQQIVSAGFEKYEAKEVKAAENHYSDALAKLAYRLNQKGIIDGSDFNILTARVGVNIEITIKHGQEITKAWTIIAEGPIQKAHFRYLVK